MAPTQNTLLLFGDQTGDIASATKQLSSLSKHSPLLQSFLQQAEQAIQRQGRRHYQQYLPADLSSTGSLLSLASTTDSAALLHPATRTLLFTVVQLGNLIYLYSAADSSSSSATKILLASCTGLFPAAVAATSRSLAEMVSLSAAVVVLALKVGLAAARRSAAIEESDEPKSWAIAVAGVHPEQCDEMLKEFHETNVGVMTQISFSLFEHILTKKDRKYRPSSQHISARSAQILQSPYQAPRRLSRFSLRRNKSFATPGRLTCP